MTDFPFAGGSSEEAAVGIRRGAIRTQETIFMSANVFRPFPRFQLRRLPSPPLPSPRRRFAFVCRRRISSLGIRAFMETHLPAFKEKNPQLDVVMELVRGQHPHLKGFYKNHNQRVVCVKNLMPEEILLHATRLRNALGRKEPLGVIELYGIVCGAVADWESYRSLLGPNMLS
ncbi:hypothetical protein OPV22_005168 [Ensete ventricosum]|uniref:Large ribosomal subunit protein mL43 n=1 Tax=Ensete ventricosum TaxID=4639 RepID=A0AAV8Q0J9_ENSVE|nr:hypothetical protein OPV22_005168 [Ensete ventricosum]